MVHVMEGCQNASAKVQSARMDSIQESTGSVVCERETESHNGGNHRNARAEGDWRLSCECEVAGKASPAVARALHGINSTCL